MEVSTQASAVKNADLSFPVGRKATDAMISDVRVWRKLIVNTYR
jgi:hypothetical protein